MPITSSLIGKTIPIMPISMLIPLWIKQILLLVLNRLKNTTNNKITIPNEPKTTNPPPNEKKKILFMLQMQKYLNYVISEFEIMKMLSGFRFVSIVLALVWWSWKMKNLDKK